jgi:hypothetical protein
MQLTYSMIPAKTFANIHSSAARLREDGYTARELVAGVVFIEGGQRRYVIEDGRCDCPFHQIYGICKHSEGAPALLQTQETPTVQTAPASAPAEFKATITVVFAADDVEASVEARRQARALQHQNLRDEAIRAGEEIREYLDARAEGQRAA